jgi:inner membrane organizing system protein 1
MSDKSNNKNASIPSEFKISEKWDKCLENFVLHFSAGLVAGGISSLVLARMCLHF